MDQATLACLPAGSPFPAAVHRHTAPIARQQGVALKRVIASTTAEAFRRTSGKELASMGAHLRRVRCCGDCLAGDHELDAELWRTDLLRLVRQRCVCRSCDCTYGRVTIEEPRYDQRHHQPHVHRRRRFGRRHAA
jgi:hypothetical protein